MIRAGMKLTESQYQRIADCLPRQPGNVSMTNLQLLNALLYVVELGCKWQGLPKQFGNWHTIYTRMNRWSKAGCWIGSSRGCNKSKVWPPAASMYAWCDRVTSNAASWGRIKIGHSEERHSYQMF